VLVLFTKKKSHIVRLFKRTIFNTYTVATTIQAIEIISYIVLPELLLNGRLLFVGLCFLCCWCSVEFVAPLRLFLGDCADKSNQT